MTGRLEGRVALVTGGASGIGAESARLFAREGATVSVCDIALEGAKAVAAAIRADGGQAQAVQLDVTSEESWSAAFETAARPVGRVDVLLNCAGLFTAGPIETAEVADFDRLVAVNLKGVFIGCREAVRHMKDRDPKLPWASIINVSSTAGMIGTPNTTIYTLTKGGVRLLSKSVAVEMGERGLPIRCNSLHPGGTETAMFDDILAKRGVSKEAHREASKSRNLIGRMAQPEEIANGALFLASAESSFMTGAELLLDGGYSAR